MKRVLRVERAEIILFILIALFSIKPVNNYDFWFHIKYGQYILATRSLPFTDVFSHTAFGQTAVPYEWLFQVATYLLYTIFGTFGVQTLVVFLAVSYAAIFRQILKSIFSVPLVPRVLLVSLAYTINYDFWVERPQSIAYVLFMIMLYLVLKRSIQKQNRLWLTIPVMIVWTNLHASMIVGLFLLFTSALVSFILSVVKKSNEERYAARDLAVTGLVATGATLLPPLGTSVYKLLFLFWQHRAFITNTIEEWSPLPVLVSRYHLYLTVMVISYVLYVVALLKKKQANLLHLFPLAILGSFIITGVRQTAFTIPAILLLATPFSSRVKLGGYAKGILTIAVLLATVVALIFYRREVLRLERWYPQKAISFIKKANVSGNMFNELETGGFLLYHLGPELKTFIDGRTDMFLPEVFPEQAKFHEARYQNDTAMYLYFSSLVKKHRISWVILSKRPSTPWIRLTEILRHELGWFLVFEDEISVIFVSDDGLNNAVVEKFAPRTTR